jgi:ankyrin repeat protein
MHFLVLVLLFTVNFINCMLIEVNKLSEKRELFPYIHQLAIHDKTGKDFFELLSISRSVVNTLDRQDNSALHKAAAAGNFESLRVLIAYGAHANQRNFMGRTPLHYLSFCPDQTIAIRIAQMLLAFSADINARDNAGWTPLHMAAWRGKIDLFAALHKLGANASLKNRFDKTPYDLCAEASIFRSNPKLIRPSQKKPLKMITLS